MSLTISAASSNLNPIDNSTETATQVKPSLHQELHQLTIAGYSPAQIATKLGMSVSLVDESLGIRATTQPSEAEATVAAGRLSVQA
jgi:hypothetical protein